MDICLNIESVKKRITAACERSGRDSDEITLIAVSKTKPLRAITEAMACGQRHFGENKVQELLDKMDIPGDDIQWHMIGALQTNKIRFLAKRANWIHSISKQKHLTELEKRAAFLERNINVLIQVNISGEDQKSGFHPDDLKQVLALAQNLKWTRVRGLMGMAAFTDNTEAIRPEFRLLRELRDAHTGFETERMKMHHLSMGMTGDLETAIEEGSTMVRVGTAIFGGRE
ncbi:MAG: YggS family pyridoxal phosphate-dependent enzyme [Balneolales bacterium]